MRESTDNRRRLILRGWFRHFVLVATLGALVVLPTALVARADAPRVLPADARPKDVRLERPQTLNGYFPFQPPATAEAWQERANYLRRHLQVALGLWPMPTKTPDKAIVNGRVNRDNYTVERVSLESYPGHFVTGSLYRPKGKTGRLPAVLCPHGHWRNGRFYDEGPQEIRKRIVEGAERFEVGGRSPLQSRCVQLARMGCVVFHYDMVGYGDSTQIVHNPGVRPQMNTLENWGYFSPQAEAHLQHMFGLQTYNSIRALDWFTSLPDVDPERIAVTGASGGGTQTFMLCAIDPRPKVAFPAVMVSTGMQGGCTCENGCYVRVGVGNVEIAALFAPKPLGMTAADDWTREIAQKGLPELKALYKTLGVPDLVSATPLLQFGHNYNYVSRAVMYSWINKHLGLGLEEPIVEEDYIPLSPAEMTVWTEKRPKPPSGDDYERSLVKWIQDDAQKQIAAAAPRDAESLAHYRELVGGAVNILVGRKPAPSDAIEFEHLGNQDRGSWMLITGLVRNKPEQEELPTVFLFPKEWKGRVVVWPHDKGKAGLFDTGGEPIAEVSKLMEAGVAVVGADLFFQGEFLTADEAAADNPRSPVQKGLAGYAGYVYGYNYTLFAKRVHDLITLVSAVKHNGRHPVESIDLVGLQSMGPVVAFAAVPLRENLARVAVDTGGFRFGKLEQIDHPQFLPGGAKYGDLPGILALSAGSKLWLAGEGAEATPLIKNAYSAAGAPESLTTFSGEAGEKQAAAIGWLLQ